MSPDHSLQSSSVFDGAVVITVASQHEDAGAFLYGVRMFPHGFCLCSHSEK